MARYLSTNALIDSVRRRAMLPKTQITFTEADFLAFANEEMDIGVVPHILSFHEDYLLVSKDIPLQRDIRRYNIPDRAIGNKLRDVAYVDPSGNVFEMTRIFIEDTPYFQYGPMGSVNGPLKAYYTEGTEVVLMPSDNPNINGYLRMSYYTRPNQLVSESEVAKITAIDYLNGILTVDQIPSSFSGESTFDITSSKSPYKLVGEDLVPNAQAGTVFTFGTQQTYSITCVPFASITNASYFTVNDNTQTVSTRHGFYFDKTGSTPAPVVAGVTMHKIDISTDTTAANVATRVAAQLAIFSPTYFIASALGSVVTFSNAGNSVSVGNNYSIQNISTELTILQTQVGTNTLPLNLNIDDIFAVKEQTIIPQIPVELHSMLAQRVAVKCLEALGDQQGLQAAMVKLAEMEIKTGSLIDNRVEGSPLKVAPKHTFLRRSRNYLRR